MRAAIHLVVRGRVQGVGFRFFTVDAAMAEGIHGWVANRPDGSVEVEAEGEREALERFERRVRNGPPVARVDSVERTETAPTGSMSGFEITRGT